MLQRKGLLIFLKTHFLLSFFLHCFLACLRKSLVVETLMQGRKGIVDAILVKWDVPLVLPTEYSCSDTRKLGLRSKSHAFSFYIQCVLQLPWHSINCCMCYACHWDILLFHYSAPWPLPLISFTALARNAFEYILHAVIAVSVILSGSCQMFIFFMHFL